MVICLDVILACDRRMDRQTDGHGYRSYYALCIVVLCAAHKNGAAHSHYNLDKMTHFKVLNAGETL